MGVNYSNEKPIRKDYVGDRYGAVDIRRDIEKDEDMIAKALIVPVKGKKKTSPKKSPVKGKKKTSPKKSPVKGKKKTSPKKSPVKGKKVKQPTRMNRKSKKVEQPTRMNRKSKKVRGPTPEVIMPPLGTRARGK